MSFKTLLKYSASALMAAVACSGAWAQDDDEDEDNRDVIVVTGVRASISQSLDVKRNSTQVVDAIVAEDIGKLPDNNVVEALQRVSGVQVTDRPAGEVGAVFIRGLPDVTTTWNGRLVFTASGRQVALQDIPSNLVRRIDVYKTRAAEQIETGIAGQIDVMTLRPLDLEEGFSGSIAARGVYQEQSDRIDPNISGLIANHWASTGSGEFGALLNVSYSDTNYRNQSITAGAMVPFATADSPPMGAGAGNVCNPSNPGNWGPLERIFPTDCRAPDQTLWETGSDTGLSYAPGSTLTINGADYEYLLARDALFALDSRGERERPAVNAALQWAPNDRSVYTAEFFYQGYRETIFNDLHFTLVDWWGGLSADPGADITLIPGTNIIKTRDNIGFPFRFQSGDVIDQNTDSYVYALNGQWRVTDRFDVTADLSYQDSEFETQFTAIRTLPGSGAVSYDVNRNDGIPSWRFTDEQEMLAPSYWTIGELYQNGALNEGDAVTLSVDGDLDLSGNGALGTLSFGARLDNRSATENNAPPTAVPFLGQPMTTFGPDFAFYNKDFFDGRADVQTTWLVANGYYILNHQDEIFDAYGVSRTALEQSFTVDETTNAAYLQLDMTPNVLGRPLYVQGGIRYVDVSTDMTFTDLNDPMREVSTASAHTSAALKNLTLIYDATDNLRFRFNYGETLRRPNFVDLNPNFALTEDLTMVGYGQGSGGNPNLRPTESTNYDIGVEWYFADDSALYATAFRREIDGLVVSLRNRVVIPGTGLNTDVFVVSQPLNASDGELEGFEAGLVYFPDYLPGVLDGLGVLASVTKLDSSQNIPQANEAGEIVDQFESEFFGVSDFSYNITAAYDSDRLGARLSYVWRDNFLNNNEQRLFANPIGIWRRAEESLDLQLSYYVAENATLTFDAVNLTDELEQSYYAFGDRGGPDITNFGNTIIGRTFAVGLRYSF